MKKIMLILSLLIFGRISIYSQQTQDLGNGMKVTFNIDSDGLLNGPYTVKINHKSSNGGTSIGSLTGKMLNGKKDGAWVGSIQYQNYGIQEDWFIQGQVNLVRTYSHGMLNGEYIYKNKTQGRKGSYNYFTNTWGYRDWTDESEECSAYFENGLPTEIKVNRNKPFTDIEMYFKDGLPNGKWKMNDINENTSLILNNGFVTYGKSFYFKDNWGTEVKYTPEEIDKFETTENVQKVDVTRFVDYTCFHGGYFKNILMNISSGSTERLEPIYYKLVDYKLHENLIGDIPDWKISSIESDKKYLIKKQKEEEAQVFISKYASEFNEKYKDYHNFFNLINGSKDYYEMQFYKDNPQVQELAKYDNRIDQIRYWIENEEDVEKMYRDNLQYYIEMVRKYDPEISDNDALEYIISHAKFESSGRLLLDLSYYHEIERTKLQELARSPLTETDIRMYLYAKYGQLRYPLKYDKDLIIKIFKFRSTHINNEKFEYPEATEWIEFINEHKGKIGKIDKEASSIYKYYQKKRKQ